MTVELNFDAVALRVGILSSYFEKKIANFAVLPDEETDSAKNSELDYIKEVK